MLSIGLVSIGQVVTVKLRLHIVFFASHTYSRRGAKPSPAQRHRNPEDIQWRKRAAEPGIEEKVLPPRGFSWSRMRGSSAGTVARPHRLLPDFIRLPATTIPVARRPVKAADTIAEQQRGAKRQSKLFHEPVMCRQNRQNAACKAPFCLRCGSGADIPPVTTRERRAVAAKTGRHFPNCGVPCGRRDLVPNEKSQFSLFGRTG
jgi:hypothetical protein